MGTLAAGGADCCCCEGDGGSFAVAVAAVAVGCGGGCCAGAGDGTGRLGGVGAGTGEPLVPLQLNGRLGGSAPGNSCFLEAGVDANITLLASEPWNQGGSCEKMEVAGKFYMFPEKTQVNDGL